MLDPLEGESAMIIEGLLPCNVNSKVNFWEDRMILGGKKLNSESSFLQAWQTCLQSETLKMFLCSYISIFTLIEAGSPNCFNFLWKNFYHQNTSPKALLDCQNAKLQKQPPRLDWWRHIADTQEIFNNYFSSPNGLWVNSPWGWRPNGLLTQKPWGLEE